MNRGLAGRSVPSLQPEKTRRAKAVSKDVVVLNNENWKREVAEAEGPVLVDFWAEWCPPCRMIAPAVEALATTYAGRAKVAKLNIDESPEVANAFGVRSIPTLLVFREGKVVDAQIGAVPQSSIARMIESQLEPRAATRTGA
jgi:thioredoxin 1